MNEQLSSIEDLLKKPGTPAGDDSDTKTEPASKGTSSELSAKMQSLKQEGREEEIKARAAALGIGYIALKGFPISPDALTQIPLEKAKELGVLCFLFTGPEIRLGTTNPESTEVQDLLHQLQERNKAHGGLYLISEESFAEGLKLYDNLPKIRKVVKGVQIKEEELQRYQDQMNNMSDIAAIVGEANVTDILSIVVAAAIKLGSSDIHIEAEEHGIAVRFRVDGILQSIATLERSAWKKIINRIKLIAGLKLNITDKPQDGRFTIFQKNNKIDVRTSTIPTSAGESVVMRILNPDTIKLDLKELGFRPASLDKLLREIQKPNGMIVTTGPTGSGKTTTLYAVLKHLNTSEVKILTLEDPVEYKLEGINQSQIDTKKDYTFAKGLRSLLRQDPDIVMVGEIRDLETAETAIQAALTGHLLISTIHTNDAAGAIPRFLSMGVKPFVLAPALNAIMGQRLLRKLCQDCKQPAKLSDDVIVRIAQQLDAIPEQSGETFDIENLHFFSAKGCKACNNTGYKGRIGIYEILLKDDMVEQFILEGEVSEPAVREIAKQQGMVTMTQDGILKALEGTTSIEEVQRVTGL